MYVGIIVCILFCCRNISLHAILSAFTSNLTENNACISDIICKLNNKHIYLVWYIKKPQLVQIYKISFFWMVRFQTAFSF